MGTMVVDTHRAERSREPRALFQKEEKGAEKSHLGQLEKGEICTSLVKDHKHFQDPSSTEETCLGQRDDNHRV